MKSSILFVILAVTGAIVTSWTPGAIGGAIVLGFAVIGAVGAAVLAVASVAFINGQRRPSRLT